MSDPSPDFRAALDVCLDGNPDCWLCPTCRAAVERAHSAVVARADAASARLDAVRALLATWRKNRADPRYGTGTPGPLYAAGMAMEADTMIRMLAEALDDARRATGDER